MEDGRNNKLVMVLPSNLHPSRALKSLAPVSPFSTVFDGRNIFFPSHVEEALWDYQPERVVIVGTQPERVFYSAVGAVDWFIVADARFRNPQSLKVWDLVAMGKKVTAILPPGDLSSGNGGTTLREVAFDHMKHGLRVASTDDDFRFTPVPDHKIAIDLIPQ